MSIEKGLQEGRQEGERVLLRRLLTQRFGPLPDGVEQQLHAATVPDLERWADRVLDAQHLDEVFRTPAPTTPEAPVPPSGPRGA